MSAGGGTAPVWSKSDRRLFYLNSKGIMVVTYSYGSETFTTTKPLLWVEQPSLYIFDLAAGGNRFAVVRSETAEPTGPTQVTLLLNFDGELRRRFAPGQ